PAPVVADYRFALPDAWPLQEVLPTESVVQLRREGHIDRGVYRSLARYPRTQWRVWRRTRARARGTLACPRDFLSYMPSWQPFAGNRLPCPIIRQRSHAEPANPHGRPGWRKDALTPEQ